MIVVFAGPTISHGEIAELIDCVCLPPVCHGDILKVLPQKPDAIGIIDGYFEGAPSVWHKEILYALDQGVHVYGCSSMGALRAAELYPFGMEGVGRIFEWYRDGVIEDDDEVAVLHGPEEVGFTVASEPMVSVRATLELACSLGVISDVEKDSLVSKAKKTFYKNRTWRGLLESCEDKTLSGKLKVWLGQNQIDLKKQDAIQMLELMEQKCGEFASGYNTNFHFEWTNVWDDAFNEHGEVLGQKQALNDNDRLVLDQLRLDPDGYQRFRDKALLCWICDNRVETLAGDDGIKAALKNFRRANQLSSRVELVDYVEKIDWDEEGLRGVLQQVARVDYIREAAGDLGGLIVDQLKLEGEYLGVLEVAVRKAEAITAAGLDVDEPGVIRAQLLGWYFENQLGRGIPQRISDYLGRIDIEDVGEFYRLIAGDYLYWRVNRV